MEFGIKEILGTSSAFSLSDKIWTSTIYKIVFIPEKGSKLSIQGEEFEFEPFNIIFIPKEIQLQCIGLEDRPFTLIYFSEEFFNRSVQDSEFLKDCGLFSGEDLLFRTIKIPEGFNSMYNFIEDHLELSKNNYGQLAYRELAYTLIKQIILLGTVYLNMFPVSEQFADQSELLYARRFQQLVDEFVISEKKVPFYAEKLEISPRKLTSISKKVLGRTPKELINEGFLRLSKRMLSRTQKSIRQIAWELQYTDENNFSSTFLKLSGVTPREYRKRWQK